MPYIPPQTDPGKVLREVKDSAGTPLEYQIGPLVKSKETKLFEEIITDIITDIENQSVDSYHKKVNFEEKDGNMYITHKGIEINMNDLIKNVNFNHLELPEAAFRSYENIYRIYKNTYKRRVCSTHSCL